MPVNAIAAMEKAAKAFCKTITSNQIPVTNHINYEKHLVIRNKVNAEVYQDKWGALPNVYRLRVSSKPGCTPEKRIYTPTKHYIATPKGNSFFTCPEIFQSIWESCKCVEWY